MAGASLTTSRRPVSAGPSGSTAPNGLGPDPGAADRPTGRAGPTRAWLAVVILGAAAVWFGIIGWQTLSASGHLVHDLVTAQGRMAGPVLLLFVGAVFLAEQRWPAVRRPLLARAHLVDAGYLLLLAVVVGPLVSLLDTGFAEAVVRHAHFLLLGRLPLLPKIVVSALILIGIDAMNWLAHVNNHRSAAMWRLHALHHSQEDMSVFTTFRTHPLAHASYLPALIPALVLGASGTVPGGALIVYGCLVTIPHANLRSTFGPLGRILVSPAYHRLHHAYTPLDDRGSVNFGFALVCWDQLSRRAAYPSGGTPIRTGIDGQPVPIEQAARTSRVPGVMVAQIVQPFVIAATRTGQS
jgi:sterol desaturase/sphingolipid hydroxylase (fatty acid hydroxylase superfamily)